MARAKGLLAAVCLALLAAPPAGAALLTVTNDADTTAPGTFRTAVGSATTGADGITWATANGGTITLGSALPGITGGTQIVVSSAASAVTITGAAPNVMPLLGAVSFTNDNAAQILTISAPVTGAGSLTKLGGGELDLLGANTFTGGAVLSSGTLVINSDAALGDGSGAFTINTGTVSFTGAITSTRPWSLNGSAFVLDNGFSSTLSGGVGGGGSLSKSGAGVMELAGNNGYAGGTTLNAGKLRIDQNTGIGSGALTFNGGAFQFNGTSLTLSVPVTINAGGGAFDTMGNLATLSGIVSGAGGLTLTSTGTLILSGANSYAGGTSVTGGGVLNVNGDAALGAAGTAVTLSGGGTLQLAQMFDLSRPIALGAGGGVIDTNGESSTFSGLISGAGGSLTKVGAGTLVLANGANSYSGGTTVNAGTLALGASNAAGTGALTVNAGGTLDLGSFTQAVTGNFTGGGIVKMNLAGGVTNIAATGNAALTGTTLVVSLPSQVAKPAAGYVFTPITGTLGGTTLAGVVSPAAIKFTPTYGANSLTLTGAFVPMNTLAANGNQAGVGAALEPLRASPAGDMAVVLGSLYNLNASQLQAALDQIGPVSLGAVGGLGMAQAAAQAESVQRRMNALARAADGQSSTVQRYAVTGKSAFPGPLYAEAPGDVLPFDTHESGSPWGFFTSGVVATGKVQDASGPSGAQPGYSFNSEGLTAGADYRINEHLAAGMAAGYLHGHAGILAPASGTMSNSSGRLGTYATAFGESFAANLYVGGAVDAFKTQRGIAFAGVSRTATGTPHGKELNVHPSASYDVKTRDYGTFSPFAAFDYDELWIGSFQETDAGALNLSVGAQTQVTEQSALGLRYSQTLSSDKHIFTPYGSVGWRHAFNDQSRPITSALAGGQPFTVMTGRIARDGAVVGLGLAANWTQDLTLRLDYSGDYRSHYQDNNVALSARLRF